METKNWRRRVKSIVPFFAWYDLWIGAYYDRNNMRLYLCPLPCLGIFIQWHWVDCGK